MTVSGSATGLASPAPYSDAQIQKCFASLTYKEKERAKNAAVATGMIPFVGPLMINETVHCEYIKSCKKKGVL